MLISVISVVKIFFANFIRHHLPQVQATESIIQVQATKSVIFINASATKMRKEPHITRILSEL